MRFSAPITSLLAILAASAMATPALGKSGDQPADILRLNNPVAPRDGHLVLHSPEVWRRGGEND